MNKRLISVFVFAVVVAGGLTFLFWKVFASRLSAPQKPPETKQVLVASRNLETGALVKEGDVSLVAWAGPVPAQAILKKDDSVIGRGVMSPIYSGEPVLETRLAAKGAGGGLAATIPEGMRAVPVRVNDISGVAGFVLPGMRVDLLILGTPPGSPSSLGTLAKTLLQNIEVLSAGQNIQKDNEGKPISVPVITMLVTPEQAEILSLANQDTRIQLVLRNPLDKKDVKTPGTALAHLFSGQKFGLPDAQRLAPVRPRPVVKAPVAAAAPKEKPPFVMEVIQGGSRTQAKFQEQPED